MAVSKSLIFAFLFGISALLGNVDAALAGDPIRCTVIIDEKTGETIFRQGNCDQGFYPQSTFKLPLAMMGYDAGILVDEHTPLWRYRPELQRQRKIERKDTDPAIWLRDSVVWFSQELTTKLGDRAFARYVAGFGYGNENVSGGLTQAWLMSSLKISAEEQARFLLRFRRGELPISEEARQKTEAIVPRFQAADGWTIQGKTGSGWLRSSKGETNLERPLGWFVGWAVRGDRRLVFARLSIGNHRYRGNPISFETRDALIADLPKLVEGR